MVHQRDAHHSRCRTPRPSRYQDAFFEIFGQPVFYLPYFQTPDPSVKRKSGFLSPIYGNSSTLGYITGIPYYFALAPNDDFTVTPDIYEPTGLVALRASGGTV